jgi:hypothetical protein
MPDKSHAKIDAGKWLRAAVNFVDVFGGEGETSGDPAVDEPLYLKALIEFQLDEVPISTPAEMFPHLLGHAVTLFYRAMESGRSYIEGEHEEEFEVSLDRQRRVLDGVVPPPPERREVRGFVEDRWPGEGIEGPPWTTKEDTAKRRVMSSLSAEQTDLHTLVQGFLALDQVLNEIGLEANLWITESGFAALLNLSGPPPIDERRKRDQSREMAAAIVEVGRRFGLAEDWPSQLCALFPREFSQSWDASMGLRPLTVSLFGGVLEIQPAGPDLVLALQLFSSTADGDLPGSLGRVARAAGHETIEGIREAYDESFPDDPLPLAVWSEVQSLLRTSA